MHHPFGMPDVYSDPEIHGGQPVVETGIPIYLILDMLAQGFPRAEMLRDCGVSDERVQIALRFAADYMERDGGKVVPLQKGHQ